jgi:hypothetical protein
MLIKPPYPLPRRSPDHALGLKYPDLFFSPTRSNGGHKKKKEPKRADFSKATAIYEYTTAGGHPCPAL